MNKTDRIAVRVAPELKEALALKASEEQRTISMVIIRAIQAYISPPKPSIQTTTEERNE